MNESSDQAQRQSKVKYLIVLIVGLLILIFVLYNSIHWQLISEISEISDCPTMPLRYSIDKISIFLIKVFLETEKPDACDVTYARNHYLDLYLVSLAMIVYSVWGLFKREKTA